MVRYTALKGHYELEKTIGCGGFAKVKLATHILTGEKVAIKIMEKAHLGDDLPRVKLEMKALQNLSHRHICKLYQVIETEAHYFMVMEYCAGGELFDHIGIFYFIYIDYFYLLLIIGYILVEKNRLSESEARHFFRQIVSAVAYLHEQGYAHRDLKPENVLFDKDQTVKLIDFGLCAKPKEGMESLLATSCGSPTYAAPELVIGKKYFGSQVDIWSMGVLLYALLCGFLPFDDSSIDNLYRKILSGKYDEPEWLSRGSKRLISSMLQVDPNNRITIEKLVCHPWLTMGYDGPVTKGIHNFHEKDNECISVMSDSYRISKHEMWKKLSCWNYDYYTATYLILLTRKKRGLPVKLVTSSRLALKKRLHQVTSPDSSHCDQPTYLISLGKVGLMFPLSTDINYIRCKVVDSNNKSVDEKENVFDAASRTPVRRSIKRYRSPSLDKAASPGDGVSETESPLSARKVLYSIERGLCKMRHVLTPRRRYTNNVNQPLVLGTKGLCNVSTTSSNDPEQVLNELKMALISKGISCKQKGFTLRGRVEQMTRDTQRIFGKNKLSFELQVCLIPVAAGCSQQQHMVGILRKRLNGDTWCYKKVCEEVLTLAGRDLQNSTN
ncbi:hypothetical protein L9F63_011749 [Diploptera punctata]|uniref:non-specific serine/threonine protein kinase n=1 Tax=Diploptera punctata TaxID=6984 RepID=A0AAD8AEQ1_DIPPU|nr:hypothetical protein L9F63_011749 [Diploptera punctata]